MSRALCKSIAMTVRPIITMPGRSQAPRAVSSPAIVPMVSSSLSRRSLVPQSQTRYSSHSPLGQAHARKKVTLQTLQSMYKKGEPITMLTAYDFPSAHVADHAGMDMILVGDSLAMVSMGLEDTSEVTMDEMIFAARSVARATKSSFLVSSCCILNTVPSPLSPRPPVLLSSQLTPTHHRSVTCPWAPTKSPQSKPLPLPLT
jgi:3-methyl-2-oxobutanoate hydroxymethyltransferase